MRKQEKKEVVVWEKDLTPEEIRNYEKDHPGYKLSFELRHPDFPFYFSIICSVINIVVFAAMILLKLILR